MPAVMLVHDDAVRSLEIQQAFLSLQGYEIVNHVKSRAECVLLLPKSRAGIIMIRPRLSDGSGVELALQIRQARPGCLVVLTLDGDESSEIWTDILKHGFRAVLTPPFTAQSLGQAFEDFGRGGEMEPAAAAGQRTAATVTRAFTVVVASARGGAGRTLLSTNLALAIGQRGRRVTLLDFSGHPSDFSMMLDDIPRNTLEDLMGNAGHLDAELLESVIAMHPKGIRYLASPSHDFDTRLLTRAFANEVIGLVREACDVLVIDTGETAQLASEAAYLVADVVLVLASRDVVRLDATRRFVGRLVEMGVPLESIKVFVNFNELGAEVSDREIEAILEHRVDGYLPNEPEAAHFSVNSGKPMVLHDPKRPYPVVVGKVADLAANRWNEGEREGATQAAAPKRGLASLFRRS